MTVVATKALLQDSTVSIGSYDSTKLSMGSLMTKNSGGGADNWVGPLPNGIGHCNEESTVITSALPFAVNWSSARDWLFYTTQSSNTTIRVGLYDVIRATGVMTWRGFVTLTQPPSGSATMKDMAVDVQTYTTGTVAVSGTAVTGTGTAWQTARFAAGARIGFGSTDPTAITTWYYISSIGSDTGITLTGSAGTIAGGTAFVIEEVRIVYVVTNATATNGGLYVAKGLNHDTFTNGGTTIPAATSTDNIQAVYWLKDASTETNTTAGGLALAPKTSNTAHTCYVVNGANTGNAQIFVYNIRGALTVSSGADTTTLTLTTGTQAVTANVNTQRAMVLATAGHGAGSGVSCLYLVAGTTKVYRAPVSGITAASTTFLSDSMTLNLPVSNSYINSLGSIRNIIYESISDRFIFSTGTTNSPNFASKYDTVGSAVDLLFGITDLQSNALNAPNGNSLHLNHLGLTSLWDICACAGMLYITNTGGVNTYSVIYNLAFGAHWTYAASSQQRIITPSISTSGCSAFYSVFTNHVQLVAPTPDSDLSWNTEPFRVYARTTGISDNSGAWTLINDSGDLSAFGAANAIQFMFEFRTASKQCIPGRINNLVVVYENSAYIPGYFEWNTVDTDNTNGTVGFTQITSSAGFTTVTINYYREDTDANVLSQASSGSTNGQFQYWNGSAWTNGLGPDTAGTRRRFVPSAGLPSSVNLYTKITTV